MKRTNINLTDDDQRAILIIRQEYGLTNDAAAIRLALARTAGKGMMMKARFQGRIRRSEWADAARILIEQCDFHGFETDDLDTWLANGDVAYILGRELQELADAYADWIGVSRYTGDGDEDE